MEDYQRDLLPFAYNILGTVSDAQDAVQDVLLKYNSSNVQPDNERNYLIKSVINRSINLKSQLKRTASFGTWLPEPVVTNTPLSQLETKDLVAYSLLILLERCSPKQRAVFILKEAFSYSHQQIAQVLSINEHNSRKLLSRALAKMKDTNWYTEVKPSEHDSSVVENLVDALARRDLQDLQKLLSKDVAFHADGGQKVKVVQGTCRGLEPVSELLQYVFEKFQLKLQPEFCTINYQPALIYYQGSKPIVCQIFHINDKLQITQINNVVDPIKLAALKINNLSHE